MKLSICTLTCMFYAVTCLSQVSSSSPDTANKNVDTDSIVLQRTEVEPSFPGGTMEWRNFLRKTLKPNVPVKHKAPAGTYTVIVRFIVGRDGSISGITAETRHGYGMEEEVIRVMEKRPKCLPAGGRDTRYAKRLGGKCIQDAAGYVFGVG